MQIPLSNKSILNLGEKKTARSRRGRQQAILSVSARAGRSECLQVRAKDIRRHQAPAVTLNGPSVLSPSRNDLLNDLIDAERPPQATTDADRPPLATADVERPLLTSNDAQRHPLATVSSSWLFVISYFWCRTIAAQKKSLDRADVTSLQPLLERSYHCSDTSLDALTTTRNGWHKKNHHKVQYHRDSDTSKTHSPNKDRLHFLFTDTNSNNLLQMQRTRQ